MISILLNRLSIGMFLGVLVMFHAAGCGANKMRVAARDPIKTEARSRLDWLAYDPARVNGQEPFSRGLISAPILRIDGNLAKVASGFGIEKAEKMDLGVYGKVGKHTVFVAPRSAIGDYDRLYWVMVRMLSEKYGCFIVGKVSTAKTVRFDCRDRRTVVLERDISGGFAKLAGRQFDAIGREIIIKPRAVASR